MAITGLVVGDSREAVVPLTVLGPGSPGARADLESVVDTGFTGHLTLPPEEARRLRLQPLGSRYVVLADGSEVPLDVYRATVLWDGRRRIARAFASAGVPLVGMALLRGSRLEIDIVPGGVVRIEELS